MHDKIWPKCNRYTYQNLAGSLGVGAKIAIQNSSGSDSMDDNIGLQRDILRTSNNHEVPTKNEKEDCVSHGSGRLMLKSLLINIL